MTMIEQIAEAILQGDALGVRSLIQDFIAESPRLSDVGPPQGQEPRMLAVAASVIELLAERSNQQPPEWVTSVAPLSQPLFLLESARTMRRLRMLCEQQTPEVFRKRGLFAPPNYLTFA